MKRVIILLFLVTLVSGQNVSMIYVNFNDYTTDIKNTMYLYQNDSTSNKFIKEMDLNNSQIQTLGGGFNYTLVIHTKTTAYYTNFNNSRIINLIFYKYWFIVLLITLLSAGIIIVLILLKRGGFK